MRILDRYIAWQFFLHFLLLLAGLFVVILLIDFSLNMDEYYSAGGRAAMEMAGVTPGSGTEVSSLASAWNALALFWDLWWPRLFQLSGFIMGMVMVGAMGFTCGQLVKQRELIASLSGGISLQRMASPIILVAVILTGLQIVNREVLVPRLAPLLVRGKMDAGSDRLGAMSQPLCEDGEGRLFFAKRVDLDTNQIEGLYVWERDASGLMTRRITASRAEWADGVWKLIDGKVEDRRGTAADGRQLPAEAIATLKTDIDPTALRMRRFEGFSHNLSSLQLGQLIDRLDGLPRTSKRAIEDLTRIRWGRWGLMATNLLALIICLPFFLRREPCNMVVQTLLAAPVALGCIGLGFACAVTGVPGLSVVTGVFVPALILLPVAIAAVGGMRT